MERRVFLGFGFGAIQGGLFLYEAYRSKNFQRLVVAEVMPDVVAALRKANGAYRVNIATPQGVVTHTVEGVEAFNPADPADRKALLAAIAESTELCTALPSVDFFDKGESSVARLLAEGLRDKKNAAVIYTAENNNHAAEFLEAAVKKHLPQIPDNCQFLNTVIGKMSGVVTDPAELAQTQLATITDTIPRALLVEEFNRILITQISLKNFQRGITVFSEKPDLLPFEEAKLYGHNAVHALLGYLANKAGLKFMSDIAADKKLLQFGLDAFLQECGPALIAKYKGLDPLFTPEGYRPYAEDLIERMVRPSLRDAVARIIRDPRRKLAWNDRLIGTMRLALDAGVQPTRFAQGAAAAFDVLVSESPGNTKEQLVDLLWTEPDQPDGRKQALKKLILE